MAITLRQEKFPVAETQPALRTEALLIFDTQEILNEYAYLKSHPFIQHDLG